MASNKNVVVLTPNGRRQNVKVTSNTTILQIIEEVCKKQKLNSNEFDIKHHNKVLDPTVSWQFSGLPNNALLELTPAQKIRVESEVTIGLQLENGTRLTGTFLPSQTLWELITSLCPDEISADNLVIIYMRNEVYGKEKLQTTTLRAMGLTGGRAMVRLVHKSPDELKIQANVSAPLPPKPVQEKPYKRVLKTEISNPTTSQSPVETSVQSDCSLKTSRSEESKQTTGESMDADLPNAEDSTIIPNRIPPNQKFIESIETRNKEKLETEINENVQNVEDMDVLEENSNLVAAEEVPSKEEIIFLGERNALIFTLETAKSFQQDDLPDEFFDLTVDDARLLLKDIKQKRAEMEDRPFQTASQRELEKNKKLLRDLNQYKRSVLRVNFPDRTVLQGTFKPLETVQVVMDFVKEYLNDPEMEFHLYTTPPKEILNPESRLIDVQCVPSAVVHFGLAKSLPENTHYLREDLLQKVSSYSAASLAASKSRGIINKQNIKKPVGQSVVKPSTSSPHPSTNPSTIPSQQQQQPSASASSDNKVPKWFKPITK